MRLALDNHYSPVVASRLRDRGCDVVAAIERGWQAESDEALLELCSAEGRALLTNNVADFMVLARQWPVLGKAHAGLVLTSDATFPRTAAALGALVGALAQLMDAHPKPDGLADRVHWLARDAHR